MRRSIAFAAGLAFVVAGCSERLTAPGACPDFCPEGTLQLVDTLLFPVEVGSDSSFRGFVRADETTRLQVVSLGDTLTSRAVVQFQGLPDSTRRTGDTTLRRIVAIDSVRVQVILLNRDTLASGLRLELYRLPPGRDTSDTFDALAAFFQPATLLGAIAVDSALPPDTTTGQQRVTGPVGLMIPGNAVPFALGDSGVLAIGIAASAGRGLPFAVLGAREAQLGAVASFFVALDSAGTTVTTIVAREVAFDSFVFKPATVGTSGLDVGGVPSARSLLRFALPPSIVDTGQVVRATLVLVPAEPAVGVPGDSFFVVAHGIAADFGAKSPLAFDPDSTRRGQVRLAPGAVDTVTIELTQLVRRWRDEPQRPRAVMLRVSPEAGSFGAVRFGSTRVASAQPALRVSYFRPFQFGGR